MKITHITFSLLNAGKENMLIDIANEQSKLGHEASIVVINNKIDGKLVERISNNVKFICVNRVSSTLNPLPILKLHFFLWKTKPDIIHAHDNHIARMLYYFSKTPLCLTIHGPGLNTKPMKLYKQLCAISKSIKIEVESRSTFKCSVIYNGIHTKSIRKKISFSPMENFNIIMVKRLNHQRKGQDILINAANILVKKRGKKFLRFFLVGDGESKSHLNKMVKDLDLGQYVFLLGNKSRDWVYEHLADYDLFVHPSRYEGFGLSVAEAMAAKLPVIASDIDGPAEILGKGKYGLLFESNNADDLVDKIEKAISIYKDGSIKGLVQSAYEHCLQNFDIKTTAQRYCNLYADSL